MECRRLVKEIYKVERKMAVTACLYLGFWSSNCFYPASEAWPEGIVFSWSWIDNECFSGSWETSWSHSESWEHRPDLDSELMIMR